MREGEWSIWFSSSLSAQHPRNFEESQSIPVLGQRITGKRGGGGLGLEKSVTGTSQVLQWLRHCAPNARGLGSTPGQGTGSYMLQLKKWVPHLRLSIARSKETSAHTPRLTAEQVRSWGHSGESCPGRKALCLRIWFSPSQALRLTSGSTICPAPGSTLLMCSQTKSGEDKLVNK